MIYESLSLFWYFIHSFIIASHCVLHTRLIGEYSGADGVSSYKVTINYYLMCFAWFVRSCWTALIAITATCLNDLLSLFYDYIKYPSLITRDTESMRNAFGKIGFGDFCIEHLNFNRSLSSIYISIFIDSNANSWKNNICFRDHKSC